ncbi:MAG: chemotaxis protein CheW [Nitrospirae bacterium]|nr:chemotaxis protein CheW [Nitrospirota bacterium]
MGEQEEILNEFLVECSEGLGKLDQEFVKLEKDPGNADLLRSAFRVIHTIKGTCGFLGLTKLENVAHAAENVLSRMREGKMPVTSDRITVLLEAVDAIKEILASIESTNKEPEKNYNAVRENLDALLGLESEPSIGESSPKNQETGPAPESKEHVKEPAEARTEGDTAGAGVPSAETRGSGPVASENQVRTAAESSIRVDISLLDNLMNLVGELVLARNQLLMRVRQRDDALDNATAQRMNLVTTELQDTVMKTRLQPIRNVWDKFPRVVRDLSKTGNKEVELVMEGAETELDRTLLEAIKDPLTHIVRNAVDHGFEAPEARKAKGKPAKGVLFLKAFHEGGQINIEITDDGAGIDVEKVKRKAAEKGLLSADAVSRLSEREALALVFLPGLSTAEKVTNVSGRGVGMDVVRTNIEKIGGTVEISSRVGQGTTLWIKIPLTLAIIPALMVKGGGELFAIPQASLLELVRVDEDSVGRIEMIHEAEFYRLRGTLLPLLRLKHVLRISGEKKSGGGENIVVLATGKQSFGLVVDEVIDSQEIVVKPLGRQLKWLSVFAGATILGDGKVALILDVTGIAKKGGLVQSGVEDRDLQGQEDLSESAEGERQSLLVFNVSGHNRFTIPLSLVARLEEFDPARIEKTVGGEVVQYREGLLPLISLAGLLGETPAPRTEGTVPVVVFSDDQKSVGLVVGQILDIVDERIKIHRAANRKAGVSGSVVIQGKTVDLLDIYQIIELAIPGWHKGNKGEKSLTGGGRILLVEDSGFFRSQLRPSLEMEGYEVIETEDGEEALSYLGTQQVDLVVSDIEMPRMDGLELAKRIRSQSKYESLPIIALTSLASDSDRARGKNAGFTEYLIKFDRDTVLEAVKRCLAGGPVISAQNKGGSNG